MLPDNANHDNIPYYTGFLNNVNSGLGKVIFRLLFGVFSTTIDKYQKIKNKKI